MTDTTLKTGFFANDAETFFVTDAGNTYIIYSADDLGTTEPVAIDSLPEDATAVPTTPDLVERVSGIAN